MLETGVDREIALDPGWDDHSRGVVAGWYALVLASAAVAIVGLVASLTDADSVCTAGTTACNHSWSSYFIVSGAAIGLSGLSGVLLDVISLFGSMEGGVSTRPIGGTWTSVSLAPTFDASGRMGAQGAITVRF